jgi:hypothetical protein
MAAKKFLRLISGIITEIAGVVTSAGAGNDGDFPVLDATGRLDVSMMPVGIGPEVQVMLASEALSAGDLVNIWLDSAVAKARKADNSTAGKEANGFVLASFASGASATVYGPSQMNTARSGLTIGATYWLGTTGGLVTTPPTGAGVVSQVVGKSVSATTLMFNPLHPITLAA